MADEPMSADGLGWSRPPRPTRFLADVVHCVAIVNRLLAAMTSLRL